MQAPPARGARSSRIVKPLPVCAPTKISKAPNTLELDHDLDIDTPGAFAATDVAVVPDIIASPARGAQSSKAVGLSLAHATSEAPLLNGAQPYRASLRGVTRGTVEVKDGFLDLARACWLVLEGGNLDWLLWVIGQRAF